MMNPEIKQAVDSIQVIDTHEHQIEESERLQQKLDFFSLFTTYAVSDLVLAGMTKESRAKCENPDVSIDEKWRLFEPHYLASRHTGYMRAVRIAIRDLYGIEKLNRNTYATLTDRIRARNKPGVLRWILRERSNIRICQVCAPGKTYRLHTDADLFQQDLDISFLMTWPLQIEKLSRITNMSVNNLKSYGKAIDKLIAMHAPIADAIKQVCAYWRTIHFSTVSDADAERIFEATLMNAEQVPFDQRILVRDWAFHRCIQRAIDHDLPIKIHTGYTAGNNAMQLDNLNPRLLTNLLIAYPKAKFALFHIGYPYQEEMLAIAKHFSNVYLDMCWSWILDHLAARRFLKQFLTTVPASKLFAFGGDYPNAEPVYGHLRMARDGIARVLSELVEEEWFTADEAIAVAQRILHDNAAVVFKVDAKMAALRAAQTQPAP